MKFYISSNNSVIAVISEEHAARYGLVKKAGGDPIAAGCKVFTFCDKERMERGVEERMTFTGTYEDLDRLVKAGDHELVRGDGGGWNGYVPFSNGHQIRPLPGRPAPGGRRRTALWARSVCQRHPLRHYARRHHRGLRRGRCPR